MADKETNLSHAQIMTGRCACGSVTFTARAKKSFGVCHCRTCRRWAGGVWMGVRVEKGLEIDGPINIWNSSQFAERANCKKCGGAIWHKAKKSKLQP